MSNGAAGGSSLVPLEIEREITAFLFHEAALLDERRFDEWLGLLDEELSYRMPVRSTRPEGQGSEFSEQMLHFDETRETLAMRVERLKSGDAWAEVPPSRTRHYVTNIRITGDGRQRLASRRAPTCCSHEREATRACTSG